MTPEEFTDFYAGAFRRLAGQLYVMTGDHAEAHDAVQEAFVRAWAHHEKLDADGAPEAWVRPTAWRIAMSRWNRARLGSLLMRSHPQAQAAAGPTSDRIALVQALRKVTAAQRRALVLFYLCDLTIAQIAAETGVAEGTVKARLARGRAALLPHLREPAGQGADSRGSADGGWAMPDLGDELQQIAGAAAEEARPLPPPGSSGWGTAAAGGG